MGKLIVKNIALVFMLTIVQNGVADEPTVTVVERNPITAGRYDEPMVTVVERNPILAGRYTVDLPLANGAGMERFILNSGDRYFDLTKLRTGEMERFYFAKPEAEDVIHSAYFVSIIRFLEDQFGREQRKQLGLRVGDIGMSTNRSYCVQATGSSTRHCIVQKVEQVKNGDGQPIQGQYEVTKVNYHIDERGNITAKIKKARFEVPADAKLVDGELVPGIKNWRYVWKWDDRYYPVHLEAATRSGAAGAERG